MNGKEFIRRARRYARRTAQTCYFDQRQGKGSHGMLYLGNRQTVVKHGEISRGMLTTMLGQLGIDREDFRIMRYAYPCNLVPDEEEGEGFVVTFPDVPGAITGALTREESLVLAEDALVAMLAVYVQKGRDIPVPSPLADGQELVAVLPVDAGKLALYTAMREQGITEGALADRLELNKAAVRNLLNLGYRSHISQVMKALRAVGRSLIVEDRAA